VSDVGKLSQIIIAYVNIALKDKINFCFRNYLTQGLDILPEKHSSPKLFRPRGMIAYGVYVLLMFFSLFHILSGRTFHPVISGSTGSIFTKFSPYGRYLFVY